MIDKDGTRQKSNILEIFYRKSSSQSMSQNVWLQPLAGEWRWSLREGTKGMSKFLVVRN